tara:strand:+ start:261 stop:452 length:192 start_codon:yes stop_codon:yes gene_type:complete
MYPYQSNKTGTKPMSYKLYVNGELVMACYTQAKFKEAARNLEALHGQTFNAIGSILQSNVKTK